MCIKCIKNVSAYTGANNMFSLNLIYIKTYASQCFKKCKRLNDTRFQIC